MKSMKRANRRHHLSRMKAKARRIYPTYKNAHKIANHLHPCSGACCGNPRRWFGDPTRQELYHDGPKPHLSHEPECERCQVILDDHAICPRCGERYRYDGFDWVSENQRDYEREETEFIEWLQSWEESYDALPDVDFGYLPS